MKRKLRDAVVVITGASSGIGRATAMEFARRGSNLVLTARSEESLREAARECERFSRALVVPADITDEAQVKAVAQRALDEFGRIDVWVNNAGVAAFGPFDDVPTDVVRRVIDTNVFGCVHGIRAALPCFRRQRSGTIINVSSHVGLAALPQLTAYTMSKFAVRGLGESIREELHGTGINVCTILPPSTDTPLFGHAANYSGRAIKPVTPVHRPETIARTIVQTAARPRREVIIGGVEKLGAWIHNLAPRFYERVIAPIVAKGHFQPRIALPDQGNLFEAKPEEAAVRGGWRERKLERRARVGAYAAGIALAAGAVLVLMRKRH